MTHFMSNVPDINYYKQLKFAADTITLQTITNARFMLVKYQGVVVVLQLNRRLKIQQQVN